MAMNKDMTRKQKIEYIKDYYKWHIIIALLVVVAIVLTIVHFATKEEYDIRLFYVGEAYFGSDNQDAVNSLTDFCRDVTGDGEVEILFDQFCYGGLQDPQYLNTMTATLEKMLAKEKDVCLVLADESLAKMILAMSGAYIRDVTSWAEGVSEDEILTVSGVKGAVSLKNSAYLKKKGIFTEDLYLILLKKDNRDALIYENAEKVAKKLIEEDKSVGIIGGADGPTAIFVSTGDEAEDMISSAILSYNSGHYLEGECVAEGHLILTDKTENGKRIVSLFASYGEYGFENGNFVKVSGSGAIPCRITFDKEGKVEEYLMPEDGAGYEKSVREMFDDETYAIYEGRSKSGDAYTLCSEGERLYARRYLDLIGREAEIGEYGDFSHELLTDSGVSVEVSNAMISRKDEFSNYFPYFVGTAEHIIDGVRYVFETGYDEEKAEISYIQYEYGKSAPVRGMIYSSVTGELLREI